MVVGVICLRMGRPCDSAHPRCGYGLEDDLIRDFAFIGGDRHSAIQDIEREPIRAAHQWPNRLLEHCDFFRTVEPAHFVGATKSNGRPGSSSMAVIAIVVFVHPTYMRWRRGVTQLPM